MATRFDFLSEGGEMGALMRAHDWGRTPLGAPDTWPSLLQTTLRLLLTSNHPMLAWWGPELIQFYNDAYRKTMGPERHPGSLGQRGRDCWEEIWPIIGPQIDYVLAGKGATWHEDMLVPVTRHGRREDVWWTYGYSPIADNDGVQGVLVVCNDVTKEHVAREDLQAANRQLRSLFEQSPSFMCLLSGPDHVFEFHNPAYGRLVGQRDILGVPARRALPELVEQGFVALLDRVYQTGEPFVALDTSVYLQRRADAPAERAVIDLVYQPIVDARGSVNGIFVNGFDATERHGAQQAVLETEERLKEGMRLANMLVWDWDLGTQEVTFSVNTKSLFGRTWHSIEELATSVHPEDVGRLRDGCNRAIAERSSFDETIRVLHQDGREYLWLQVRGDVTSDAAGVARKIKGVSVDVTERKNAEVALIEMDRRKNEFLAMLAHELRNPLAPISNAAHLLTLASNDAARVRATGEVISRQVRHMTGLVDDLLDVSRVTTGVVELDRQLVDVKRIVQDSVEQVRPVLDARKHQFTLVSPAGSALVRGDAKRLIQAVTNVLQNAAKYTPDGGKVSLEWRYTGGEIAIAVSDSGIGMDAALLPHVFELFTQGKVTSDRSQGGLGLGLALVKSLVTLHGGRVAAASEGPGRGSVVTIFLPRAAEQPVPAVADAHVARKATTALRVLIVDDNEDAARMLALTLEAAGHVVSVENGSLEALVRANVERPDVCLLDVGLPEMDGRELARRLREAPATSGAVLVAVTGYGQEEDRASARTAGFEHFFVKPAEVGQLLDLLDRVSLQRAR